MKKIFVISLTFAFCLALLAGCKKPIENPDTEFPETDIENEQIEEKENITVSVSFADEEELSEYTEFVADETDMQVSVLFTVNGTAENFKVLGLSLKDIGEDGEITFEKEVLYETKTLTEDCPLLVKMTFFGTIPSYGIAYTDKDGKEKQFSVEMSGEDGSLFLGEL